MLRSCEQSLKKGCYQGKKKFMEKKIVWPNNYFKEKEKIWFGKKVENRLKRKINIYILGEKTYNNSVIFS